MKETRSFFKKLTGAFSPQEDVPLTIEEHNTENDSSWEEDALNEGQLTVDVYETPNSIIIKTIVAGVKKEDLEIALSRDMVTIRGKREMEHTIEENEYYHKELYWGSFSRTIMLPSEVDINEAEAYETQGLLTLKLPKIDKERKTKLKVKSV